MKTICKTAGYTTFLLLLVLLHALAPAVAAENDSVDFSCMKEQVRPIIQVTNQHQEYDVVVRNYCPGDVYWSMCIERLDPWTHEVLENHFPSGYVKMEKRARVNLQMKTTHNADLDQHRVQEFYYSVAYGISETEKPKCVARGCESRKKELRAAATQNNKAWHTALVALEAKLAEECPDNGWNAADTETCKAAINEAAQEELAMYDQNDKDLRDQMASIDPDKCTVYGGNIVKLK